MKSKGDIVFCRAPGLSGVDICWAGNSRHSFPSHFHDDAYIISLITSGSCYSLGKGRSPAGPGGVILINPGQIHSGVPGGKGTMGFITAHFSLDTMAGFTKDCTSRFSTLPEFGATILEVPLISGLIKHLFNALLSCGDDLEKEAVLVSSFHLLFSRYGRTKAGNRDDRVRHQTVIKAREMLSGELDRKITLEEVAQSVGLSRYHFLRTFKRETGTSPHQFRMLKRLEKAKALLAHGQPPARAALATGFSDQSHFSNAFRRYFGTPPGQYRTSRPDRQLPFMPFANL